jgi:hypothetical protein
MTICAGILISKTRCDLKILINPSNHEELFILLRRLRKCVKLPRMKP